MSGPGRGGRHGGKDGRGKGSSGRGLKAGAKIKAAKGRSASSTRWLERQHADPYVAQAGVRGYRSRAAFKLAQMDDPYSVMISGDTVTCSCAAGTQDKYCKHVAAVAMYREAQDQLEQATSLAVDDRLHDQLEQSLDSKINDLYR